MGLVLLADGERSTPAAAILHFTGFGWAGQVGEPVGRRAAGADRGGLSLGRLPCNPAGALAAAGGFAEHFFMYCEDVDLSLRLRLCGEKLAVIPQATVAHDYEFAKGHFKWRLLERNRWATLIRTYPAPLLLAVAPALVATEPAVWAVAARGGWAGMKGRATFDVVRALPRLVAERRAIQASARVTSGQFAAAMTASLDSPYFGSAAARPLLRRSLGAYWRAVLWLLARLQPSSERERGRSGPCR